MTESKCKGCHTQFRCQWHPNSKCPCVKCLVKVTCNLGCHDFQDFELEIRRKIAIQNYSLGFRKNIRGG